MKIRIGHASLQHGDSRKQHTRDIEKIFQRGCDAYTGTEAGRAANNTSKELKRIGKKYGYRVAVPGRGDMWVAVKKNLNDRGRIKQGFDIALRRKSVSRPKAPGGGWSDKGIRWLQVYNNDVGWLSFGAAHHLPWTAPGRRYKKQSDRIYARKMAKWMRKHAGGFKTGFIGTDSNRDDKNVDIAFGLPLTSCWDELKKYPDTHGSSTMDVIFSYDKDERVRCVGARAFSDKQMFLNTDHKYIEATYEVGPLPKKK